MPFYSQLTLGPKFADQHIYRSTYYRVYQIGRTRWVQFAKEDSFFSRAEANASQVPAEWYVIYRSHYEKNLLGTIRNI